MNRLSPLDLIAALAASGQANNAMTQTTPLKVNGDIRKFCERISRHKPVFVDYTEYGCRPNWCHMNVGILVEKLGGQCLPGWLIWASSKMIDAVHHSVWHSPDNTLVDPTPKEDGEQRVLFLPDPSHTFDYANNKGWGNRFWIKGADASMNKKRMADIICEAVIDLSQVNDYRQQHGLGQVASYCEIPVPPISRGLAIFPSRVRR